MIKIYSYYSCGGYKDMYVGVCMENAEPTYFLPLLPVMKKKAKPDLAKIERLEKLPRIEILTQDNFRGLPEEALSLISHGAYDLIYRTFASGEAGVAIRNLEGAEKDEEGRSIPFLLIILADGPDILILDRFVTNYLGGDRKKIRSELGLLFSYDYITNGIKFDMPKAYQIITYHDKSIKPIAFNHYTDSVDVILVNDRQELDVAIKEHQFRRNKIGLQLNLASASRDHLIASGIITEVKAEADVKTEPAADVKTEPAAEVKTEPAAEVKTEPAADVKTEPAAEVKTEPAAEVKTEPAAEVKTEPAADVKTEPAAEVKTEPAAEVNSKSETDTEVRSEQKAKTRKKIMLVGVVLLLGIAIGYLISELCKSN